MLEVACQTDGLPYKSPMTSSGRENECKGFLSGVHDSHANGNVSEVGEDEQGKGDDIVSSDVELAESKRPTRRKSKKRVSIDIRGSCRLLEGSVSKPSLLSTVAEGSSAKLNALSKAKKQEFEPLQLRQVLFTELASSVYLH